MIQFNKPINLNGAELIKELNNAQIEINTETSPFIDGNGNFWLDINPIDKEKASEIVANHNGTTTAPEPTVAEKLASVGLNLDELKLAILGGN